MHRTARLVVAAAVLGAAATTVATSPTTATTSTAISTAAGTASAAAPASARPALRVRRAAPRVVVERYGQRVYLDIGAYLVAGDEPFEAHTTRTSYSKPVQTRILRESGDLLLQEGTVQGFGGLPGIVRVELRDSSGALVTTIRSSLCSYEGGVRVRPDAPTVSPYPAGCYGYHRLSLGAVHGIQAGWGVPAVGSGRGVELTTGRYVATVRLAKRYRELLEVPAGAATTTIKVRVVAAGDECRGCRAARSDPQDPFGVGAPSSAEASAQPRVSPQPRAQAPTPGAEVPEDAVLPDLRSLPAFGMQVQRGHWLAFSANVWNAGPSPLVVDGFRQSGQDVMDAYQYFYDAEGNPAGSMQTGSMEWDDRDGHSHWHFTDFARYRLLDADKVSVVRSRKEAFCLANTDAVDYTVAGANWKPYNTDLHSACGQYSSLGVREVLDVGSGDTYAQFRPGQSFNVRDLEPGVYYIEVTANPAGRLHESVTGNNTAFRWVRIKGAAGSAKRTIQVKPIGLIDIG